MKNICRSALFTFFILNFTGCGLGTTTTSGNNNNNNTITEDPTNGGEYTPVGSETGVIAYRERPQVTSSMNNCPTGNSLPVFTQASLAPNGVLFPLADGYYDLGTPRFLRLAWMSEEKQSDQTLKIQVKLNNLGIKRGCGPSANTVITGSKFPLVCAKLQADLFKTTDGANYYRQGNAFTINLQNSSVTGYSCPDGTSSTYKNTFNIGQNGLNAIMYRVRFRFISGVYCNSLPTNSSGKYTCINPVPISESSISDSGGETANKQMDIPIEVSIAGNKEYIE